MPYWDISGDLKSDKLPSICDICDGFSKANDPSEISIYIN